MYSENKRPKRTLCLIPTELFLGAFTLRKAKTSFDTSVRPSVSSEQLGSHWTDFSEILYVKIFRLAV